MWTASRILDALDQAAARFVFPALDNGYVYLAATRLSLHRSTEDWALAIEVFGFSPRAGLPDLHIATFASRLRARKDQFVTAAAHADYLRANPNNESRFVHTIDDGAWQDEEDMEFLAPDAASVVLRGRQVSIPPASAFAEHGIELGASPRLQTFELCRWLAAEHRNDVLATPDERRGNVPTELQEILVLDAWHHPDVLRRERVSDSPTFRQLAEVLVRGDTQYYRPTTPNTHWRHWPEGGSL